MDFLQFSGVASVLVFGASLLLALRVLALAGEPSVGEEVLRHTAYILLAAGSLVACLLVAGPGALFIWPIVMTIWARAAINQRLMQKRSLLAALAIAVDKQMPLAPVALAFGEEQAGSFGSRAGALSEKFERGVPLERALRLSRQALPPESALAAAMGLESGDLAGALDAISLDSDFDRSWLQPAVSRLLYLLAGLLAFNLFVLFVGIRVAPRYVYILEDFGVDTPATTTALQQLPGPAEWQWRWQIGDPIGLLPEGVQDWIAFNTSTPALGAFMTFGWLGAITVLSLLGTMALAFYSWLQWRGTLMPRLPGLKRIINWMDAAPLLRGLALSTRHDRPLVGVLSAMAKLHPKRTVRRRLRRVVRDLNNGIPWHDGLRRQRLLDRNDAALLATAGASGNLTWALPQTADSFERRATFRLQALAQTVLPFLAVPFGMLTAFAAVAFFAPLAKMITVLS
jgi:type II secretory pathway component PulF